ncbi:MAG: 4Fe-4S binding protein [Candidatus Thorarchaeota archaeon]|nr:MAG: 4Fe-4S binding protein [Candidatus Thorarchaeota archaeon]
MSSSPYERLAATLDKLPNGFTHIEDGTHLRVLEWIFTPEEADLASKMKARGETAEELSTRIAIPLEGLVDKLEAMAKKGQIRAWDSSTGRRYALLVFIGGIWEEQMGRADEEFAELVEQYFQKGRGDGLFTTEPPIFKVIPVNRAVKAELEVYPYEVAEKILESAKSWGLRECACKNHKGILGEQCKYPTSVCLLIAPRRENAYDDDPLTKPISKDEAIRILHQAEEDGLIHCSMNAQKGHSYICNCCTCCCTMLRGAAEWGQPHAFLKSDYFANVDDSTCTGCESCIDRCQFDALSIVDDLCQVDHVRCVGCGVCSVVCPENALSLILRDPSERTTPPESLWEWTKAKVRARGVDYTDLV